MELRGVKEAGPELGDKDACNLLNRVLDSGINFIDTSPDYGRSESLIGKALSPRRNEFILATKCGCPVHRLGDKHDFSRENIRAAVEQSLRRMRTDWLDLVQFHVSPSRSTLEEHDSIGALVDLQSEGKVRFIGVSGEPPHLTEQIGMGVFDAFQIPYSALHRENEGLITAAAATGAGVIIRGGVARGVPGPDDLTRQFSLNQIGAEKRASLESYLASFPELANLWIRAKDELAELLSTMTDLEFLLRFTLSHPSMHTVIVGTSDSGHLGLNVQAASRGPLSPGVLDEAKRRLDSAGIGR
jgi:aryl-alcohol dehydrogenase-like predicted oxidoreductase